jgi:hypothetical protein
MRPFASSGTAHGLRSACTPFVSLPVPDRGFPFIAWNGRYIGNTSQDPIKGCRICSSGALFQVFLSQQGRHFLGYGGSDELVNRD